MKMMLVFTFLCLLLPSSVLTTENSNNIAIDEDFELERQLKLLNKPAIKTIVENGDVYDCVDINKQPAFDHPSLKDHKLQLRPCSYPVGVFDGSSSSIEIALKDGGCPSGTVPIKRVTKDDVIRMRSSMKMMNSSSNLDHANDNQEWAVYHTPYNSKDNKYMGASAFISVYGQPQLTSTQFTSSLIFVENDLNQDGNNIIKVGWTVDQSTYGDTKTRLTTGWTRNDFHGTGCIDIRCPGFVQVNKELPLGAAISPLSIYNGVQYGLYFLLFRDISTSHWWLALGEDMKLIGYWPREIFTTLGNYANWLSFGGNAGYFGNSKMPPMGSGHFPFEGANKSCVFLKVKNINSNSEWVDLPAKDLSPDSHSKCYGLGPFFETQNSFGSMFYFGGPGNC